MNWLRTVYRKARWNTFWRSFQLPQIRLNELAPSACPTAPVITEQLRLPPYAGPTDHNDAVPLLSLVEWLNPSTVLELGTAHGATVANICAVSDATVYTVNALPEQMSGQVVTIIPSRDEIGYVYRKHGFADRVVQIYENTRNLDPMEHLQPESVDLAIIDACHDPDFIVSDFLSILPTLNRESIVLFHDVHPSLKGHLADGYVACVYLRKLGYDVKHLRDTWWGVWQTDSKKVMLRPILAIANALDISITRKRGLEPEQDVLALRFLADQYLL